MKITVLIEYISIDYSMLKFSLSAKCFLRSRAVQLAELNNYSRSQDAVLTAFRPEKFSDFLFTKITVKSTDIFFFFRKIGN